MKILVCIKQVPDMESRFKPNADGDWYDNADLAWRMNEYDEFAVEQAVQVKEQDGDADLTVLSVGPERVKEMMKKALAMGCDRGVHVADDEVFKKDCYEIASVIAGFAKDKDFDLIFTGMQFQDRGSGQVGVLVAEMLGLPSITTIIDFSLAEGVITAKRELEGGIKSIVKTSLPALVTCQLGLNKPLPDLAEHYESEEERAFVNSGCRAPQCCRQAGNGQLVFPGKEGRRAGARRGYR